jgi:hypothetical protein
VNKIDFHKISLDDLQLGSPIRWDIYDANERLLARKGFVPQSEKQLETLIERGLFVDAEEYRKSHLSNDVLTVTDKKPQHHVLSMMGKALSIIQNVTLGIVAHAPLANSPTEVMKVVGLLNEAITTNPDIALACILFKQTPEGYSNRHLMDAAILSIMVARAMQIPAAEADSIAAAALTMNIGMLRLQEDLQNRAEPPTDEERVLIHSHPELSVALLKEAGVTDQLWLAYVLSHHEHIDGSGYPTGMTGDNISDGAKIIAVADRYTAMIAPRKYRKAIHPMQALRSFLMDSGKTCDAKITTFFIKELGVYPPGCCVKLVNGEIAIVIFKGITATTPAVQAIKNQFGDTLPYPENRNSGIERFAVKEGVLLEVKDIPCTMQQIWGAHAT